MTEWWWFFLYISTKHTRMLYQYTFLYNTYHGIFFYTFSCETTRWSWTVLMVLLFKVQCGTSVSTLDCPHIFLVHVPDCLIVFFLNRSYLWVSVSGILDISLTITKFRLHITICRSKLFLFINDLYSGYASFNDNPGHLVGPNSIGCCLLWPFAVHPVSPRWAHCGIKPKGKGTSDEAHEPWQWWGEKERSCLCAEALSWCQVCQLPAGLIKTSSCYLYVYVFVQ